MSWATRCWSASRSTDTEFALSIVLPQLGGVAAGVRTHCPYCAYQCGTVLAPSGDNPLSLTITGDADFPVNNGRMCVKGWTANELLTATDRLTTPLVRAAGGELKPATWEFALDYVADAFERIRREHGASALGAFGSGA